MKYRSTAQCSIAHPESGIDVNLTPGQEFDDENPYEAALIRRFPQFFEADNIVERATAAPGEKRRVKRSA